MSYHKVRAVGDLAMVSSMVSKPLVSFFGAKKTVSRVGTLATKMVSDPAPFPSFPSLSGIAYEVRGGLTFVTPQAQLLVFQALAMMSWTNGATSYCQNCSPPYSTTQAQAAFVLGQISGNAGKMESAAVASGFAVLIEKASIGVSGGLGMKLIVTDDMYEISLRAGTKVTDQDGKHVDTHAVLDAPAALLARVTQGSDKPAPAVDCANPPPGICGPPDAMARWSIEQCKCVYPQDKGGDQPAGQQQMSVASSSELPTWVVPVAVAAGSVALLAVIVAAARKGS